ncbi:hypothetical protein [Streptomyces sp. GS7]|uniref:hypothetical protein n=1 Tax=Streptomyces sp. GS7 TaxID=2692234 RepID=UPI001915E774|nr:hypothetical protein [Streptomyces sp. GS7]
MLRSIRRTVFFQLLVWSVVVGCGGGLLAGFGGGYVAEVVGRLWHSWGFLGAMPFEFGSVLGTGLVNGVVFGFMAGVMFGIAYVLSLTAWGQWVVLIRIWLPLRGRLPWAVHAFLDDAYQRGVLRQAGAVYQFRHARLQGHLTHVAEAAGRGGGRRCRGEAMGTSGRC